MSLILNSLTRYRKRHEEEREDYDIIHGQGAWDRMLCARLLGCIVVMEEVECGDAEQSSHS